MKKKSTITIIFICGALLLPRVMLAGGSWALMQQGSQVSVQGECVGSEVKIEFFSQADDVTADKTASTDCEEGKFSYLVDFSTVDLTEGNYILAVDGEKSQSVVAVTKQKVGSSQNSVATKESPRAKSEDTAEVKFLSAFVSVQQSVLDMQTWLTETSYPEFIKTSLGVALDGVNLAVGKLSELVLGAESGTADKDFGVSAGSDVDEKTTSNETAGEAADAKADSLADETDSALIGETDRQLETTDLGTTAKTTTIDTKNAGLSVTEEITPAQ